MSGGGAPTIWLAAMLVVALPTVWVSASPAVDVAIDLSSPRIEFPHYFERCVGSGHGALTLREDWRQHVDMAHKDLGIQRVRFHGILDDDMSVSFSPNETGFVNIDSICDWLLQRNMSMVMELGFMPRWLARDRSGAVPVVSKGQQDTVADGNYSCTHSINHYIGCSDPPYDFNLWGALIYELGKHLVDRYGVEELENKWMFEVWNEPGQMPGGDWWGSPAEYLELYAQAANALKKASPRLRVGGPAGCFGRWGNGKASCLETFIDFCRNNASGLVPRSVKLNGSVPLDFVSTHEYSGGATNVNNADHIVQHLATMKPIAAKAGLDHVMTEWGGSYLNGAGVGAGVGHAVGGTANYNYNTPPGWRGSQQDTHETAAFILQTVYKSQLANLSWGAREATSYWDITDVFEEGGFAFVNNSFNGNFGLVNVHGVPKPAYRAFQLLHELGDELLPTSIKEATLEVAQDTRQKPPPASPSCASTVGVLASVSNASTLSVLLFSQSAIGEPIAPSCQINVSINNPKGTTAVVHTSTQDRVEVVQGTIRRIDETNTAPKAVWLQQGMPQWPTAQQNQEIFAGSIMRKEKIAVTIEAMTTGSLTAARLAGTGQRLSFSVSVAANSVVAVQVPIGSERDLLEAEQQRDMFSALASAEKQLQDAAAKIAALHRSLRSPLA